MALIDSTTILEKGDKCRVHEAVSKAVYSIFIDRATGKKYLQIDTYGRSGNHVTQSIQIELSQVIELSKVLNGLREINVNPNYAMTEISGVDDYTGNNILVVDYQPRFSSFGYRGQLHIEYNLDTDHLKYEGWNLSDKEIASIKQFYANQKNILDFFDDRLAYSTKISPRVLDSGPYSLKYQWHGNIKSIIVGTLQSIPYTHPFNDISL